MYKLAFILLSAAALTVAENIAATHSLNVTEKATVNTTITNLPPPPPPKNATMTPEEACRKLNNVTDRYRLNPQEFANHSMTCSEAKNFTDFENAGVLVKVFTAVKQENCKFTPEIAKDLIDCANNATGLKPGFTPKGASTHFGFNNTISLQFTGKECKTSENVLECVENIFSKDKLSSELKNCKTSLSLGFNETATLCKDKVVRGTRNNGLKYLPSDVLLLGPVAMLFKLAVLS